MGRSPQYCVLERADLFLENMHLRPRCGAFRRRSCWLFAKIGQDRSSSVEPLE